MKQYIIDYTFGLFIFFILSVIVYSAGKDRREQLVCSHENEYTCQDTLENIVQYKMVDSDLEVNKLQLEGWELYNSLEVDGSILKEHGQTMVKYEE